MRRVLFLFALAPLGLLPLAACGDDGGAADPGGTIDPVECAERTTPAAPCDGRACFTACGIPVAIDDAPELRGFDALERPATKPFAAARVALTLATLNDIELQIRHGETAEILGTVPLPGPLDTVASLEGLAIVGSDSGRMYPIVLNDPAAPVVAATWRPQVDDDVWGMRIAGTTTNRLVLQTSAGLSLLDLTNPGAPVEERCLTVPVEGGMGRVWDVEVGAYFIAAAGGETPLVFTWDLQRPEAAPVPLPIDDRSTVVLHEESLYVARNGEIIEFSVVPGQAISEVRRASATMGGDPPVAGGFLLLDGVALDLEDELKPYDIVDTEAASCTVSLNAQDQSTSWVVSPNFVPDRRFDVTNFPTYDCGPPAPRFGALTEGAADPAGSRLLVRAADGWILWDPATGDQDAAAVAGGGRPVWLDGAVATVTQYGSDGSVPMTATLDWASLEAPSEGGSFEVSTPLLDWDGGGGALWFIAEAEPRAYGEEPPAASSNLVYSFTPPATQATPLPLAEDAAPIGVAAAGPTVYIFDHARKVHVHDVSTGERTAAVSAPFGLDPKARAASSLGLFVADECGGILWIDGAGLARTFTAPADETYVPLAADASALYVASTFAPHPDYAAEQALIALVPAAGSEDAFALTEIARYPLTGAQRSVAPRLDGVALFDKGVHLLERK